jgi:hypothetical protein
MGAATGAMVGSGTHSTAGGRRGGVRKGFVENVVGCSGGTRLCRDNCH